MKKREKKEKRGEKGGDRGEVLEKKSDAPDAPRPVFYRKRVIGIDPGLKGSIVLTDGADEIEIWEIPHTLEKRVHYFGLTIQLEALFERTSAHVFLERAIPMAMGSKGAFSYGRNFEAIVLAIENARMPVTYVEPSKWTREMHEGISSDLKPKAKSLIAAERLYPELFSQLPRKPKGGLQDGPVDALLIAGYGLRHSGESVREDDFY